MPYAPGVVNRAGELFAAGLSGLSDGVNGIADHFAKVYQNGKIADAIVKTNPEVLEGLGMTPEQFKGLSAQDRALKVQGFIQGQGMKQQATLFRAQQNQLDQQAGDQTIMQQVAGNQSPPGMPTVEGMQKFMADPSRIGRGVAAMTPAGLKMLTEGRFNLMADQAAQPVTAPLDVNGAMGLLQGQNPGGSPMTGGGSPTTTLPGGDLDAGTLLALARKAGMSPADSIAIARENLLSAKAAKDLRSSANPEQIDIFDLPNKQKAVALRGSKQLQILTDPTTGLQVEQVPDAAGNMHAIVRDPKTGKPMFVPAANTTQAAKANMDTMVEAEKATRAIDDDIASWNGQAARAAKDPKVKAPDPGTLRDLQRRRQRLQDALDSQPTAENITPKPPGSAANGPATPTAGVPPAVKAEFDAANAAIAAGKNPTAVKARLAQRLKALGFESAQ